MGTDFRDLVWKRMGKIGEPGGGTPPAIIPRRSPPPHPLELKQRERWRPGRHEKQLEVWYLA